MKTIHIAVHRSMVFFPVLAVILFAAGLVLPPRAAAKKPVVLNLSYPMPSGGFHGQGYTYFAKAVEEESNGEIEIKSFPARSLVGDPEALEAAMRGNVDIVNFMVAYVSPTIKELTPFEIPGAYPGNRFETLEKATHPVVEKIFAKYGVKYLGINDQNTITFATAKSVGRPVKLPSDLKGLTVRTPGRWGGEAIKMWGGSPVTVSLGDLSTALERGTIKVSYTGWIITGPFKLYEPAPYVTMTTLQEMMCGLVMSGKAWKKLTLSQQAAVERAAQRWMDFSHQLSGKLKQKFEQDVKAAGGTVYHLSESENAAFKKVTRPLMEEAAKVAGPDGQKLIDIFSKLRGDQ